MRWIIQHAMRAHVVAGSSAFDLEIVQQRFSFTHPPPHPLYLFIFFFALRDTQAF